MGKTKIAIIGSGNIGATNVLRTGRKDLAAATLLICVAATLLILVQLAQNQQKSYGGMKS